MRFINPSNHELGPQFLGSINLIFPCHVEESSRTLELNDVMIKVVLRTCAFSY